MEIEAHGNRAFISSYSRHSSFYFYCVHICDMLKVVYVNKKHNVATKHYFSKQTAILGVSSLFQTISNDLLPLSHSFFVLWTSYSA
jgi:hypothetical protein